ncbi:MAG: tRNA epoxyqueuosine(34) reductase QueG [Polyangia bacterium]
MVHLDNETIRSLARTEGLPLVGFVAAAPVGHHADFERWLEAGHAAEMTYLARDAAQRRDPRELMPSCKAVLVVALSYAHEDGLIPVEHLAPRGTIARYARGADYHTVLKRRLQRLGTALELALGRPLERLACVDSAPLLERSLAAEAGIGFSAKSAMLIAPGHGSYLSLGALLVDFECTPEPLVAPKCGTCRLCLDACPTGAFVGPYVVDARRCISYLTIENRGPIPLPLRDKIGDRIFGCDVCQEVCPFNAAGPRDGDAELAPRSGYSHPSLHILMRIGAAQFRKWQQKSALRRIHRNELLRNVAVALGNVGDAASLPTLHDALREPSALVRAHVVWAVREIARRHADATSAADAILAAHAAIETDDSVRAELT